MKCKHSNKIIWHKSLWNKPFKLSWRNLWTSPRPDAHVPLVHCFDCEKDFEIVLGRRKVNEV